MRLKKLFKKIPVIKIRGTRDLEITGVCSNSRFVSPGNLFIARRGISSDGAKYIPQAISAGCVACVTDMYDPTLPIPQVICENVAALEALIASTYYQSPSHELYMVGFTGTNGKTTSSYLTKHLLDRFIGPSGLMGTIEYIIGRHRYRPTHTTPDVCSNHKLLREMILQGCASAVMEVTSHALTQGRVDEIDYDVAIFTNLSQDHLDYHHTMEEYAKAKNILFKRLTKKNNRKKYKRAAFVNGQSPWSDAIAKDCQVQVLKYGLEATDDLYASDIEMSPKGSRFQIHWRGETALCVTPLVGKFNIYNTLAACSACLIQNIPLKDVVEQVATFEAVPGRLEPVPNGLGIDVYVDYAHTDDALRQVLSALRELKKGRIITIFGCGGDRDQEKRPLMGRVVQEGADFAIVTQDNSRSEEPDAILSQIIKGFTNPNCYIVEKDRSLAIEKGIGMAKKGDVVLIAGKGHETSQVFSTHTMEFDDRKIARSVCEKLAKSQTCC